MTKIKRVYNTFYNGEKDDDYLTVGGNIITSKNLDGLKTGYGITLGPRQEDFLKTNNKIVGISVRSFLQGSYAYGEGGEIYNLQNASDNNPSYTLNGKETIVNWIWCPINAKYYFLKQTGDGVFSVCRVGIGADNDDWSSLEEDLVVTNEDGNDEILVFLINHGNIPFLYTDGYFLYIGVDNKVIRLELQNEGKDVKKDFNIFNQYVVGLTQHGTQYYVYSSEGYVMLWDGINDSITAKLYIDMKIKYVYQIDNIDYVVSFNGDLYAMNGYTPVLIKRKRCSNRFDDNSIYLNKFNFNLGDFFINSLTKINGFIFFIGNDTEGNGIYKYGNIVSGLIKGFSKLITEQNIYTLNYIEHLNLLFFSYKNETGEFGIKQIDFNKCNDFVSNGFFITEIFNGGNYEFKLINHIRISFSNCSGNNNLKLYTRIDNGEWELVRILNNQDNNIDLEYIYNFTRNFFDIQFKVEFNYGNNDGKAPILHSLELIYEETPKA